MLKKWEYSHAFCGDHQECQNYLNYKGKEGWETIALLKNSDNNEFLYEAWMKREIPEPPKPPMTPQEAAEDPRR